MTLSDDGPGRTDSELCCRRDNASGGGQRVHERGAHLQQQPQRLLPTHRAVARRHDVLSL